MTPGPDYAERVALAIPLDALARRLNYHAANCLTDAESLANFRAALAVEMRRAASEISSRISGNAAEPTLPHPAATHDP